MLVGSAADQVLDEAGIVRRWASKTPIVASRVDRRAIGSSLSGSARSSRNPSQSEMPAPAYPPVAANRAGSRFHLTAL